MFKDLTRREFIKTTSLAALAMAIPVELFASPVKADLVIYGNFYTVDEKNPKAEAVAIKNGKYVYVGAAAGVKEFVGKDTKEQRYNKGLILPGLVDAHSHGPSAAPECCSCAH